MMHQLLHILKLRRTIIHNSIIYGFREKVFKLSILFAAALLFIIGDYIFFYRIIGYLYKLPLDIGELLITQLLGIIFLTFFSMLLFSNVITSISTMYLSSDLELLMASPFSISTVFISKFLQTAINSSWMILIFGFPIFAAYGVVYKATLSYYLLLIPVILPFLAIPAGIGILITMLLMRFFPAKKTYQVMTLLGLIFGAGLVMFFRFLKPEVLLGKDVPDNVIIQFVEGLKVPDYSFLPSTWAAKAFINGVNGEIDSSLIYLLYLSLTALSVFVLSTISAKKVYHTGWASAHESFTTIKRRREPLFYIILNRLLMKLFPVQRNLFMKDIKLFFRDAAQWSQLFMLGALVIVYIFNIRNLPLDSLFLKNFTSVLNHGLAGVVLSAIAVRFVFTAVSLEGKYFWTIYASPVDFKKFLWEKFWMYFIPLLILAEILVVVSNMFLNVDIYIMALSVISIFLITAGLVGMGIGMGTIYPLFKYENVAEVAMSTGGILYMITSFIFIGAIVILESRPVYVHFYEKFFFVNIGGIEAYLCYALILLISAAATFIPMILGTMALKEMEI
jgi:ABC-2 type transport system permease protein